MDNRWRKVYNSKLVESELMGRQVQYLQAGEIQTKFLSGKNYQRMQAMTRRGYPIDIILPILEDSDVQIEENIPIR